MFAMDELLGSSWRAWEPETLWLTLDRMRVSVPVGNREQIMAARSLLTTSRFYYDMHAFEKTCIVFNNEEANYEALDDAPIMYISWAVAEAEMIYRHYEGGETLELDREPVCYTAVQLHRAGFVQAPTPLGWAQKELDKHNASDVACKKLQATVREGWAAAPRGKDLLSAAFPETPEGVQLARLAAVHVYHERRRREREQQLAKLKA
jgi:hypothetical protein